MHYLLLFVGILFLIFSVFILNIPALSKLDLHAVERMSLYRTEFWNRITLSLSVIGGMPFVLFLSTLWCIALLWYKKHTSVIFICIGIIGGIGVGYSAGYAWQTVFNTFGALSIASNLFGMTGAVILRIGANVFASVYTVVIDKLLNKIFQKCIFK